MPDAVPAISFRYHPDPRSTGSAVEDDRPCSLCGQQRGLRYTGPIYGDQPEVLCLVCISSGEAATTLAVRDHLAEFTDVGVGVPDGVSQAVLDEVAHRTPGFIGWQQERWMYHCDDAAAFIGRAGAARLANVPDALDMVMHENDSYGWTPEESRTYVEQLHEDGDATAYLFRCLHCGIHLAYTDMN